MEHPMPNRYRKTPGALRQEDESPFRLADLPPEIRILIFEEYLRRNIRRDNRTRKKLLTDKSAPTPDLIKALRPVHKLYSEALDVFFNLFTLSVSKNNERKIKYLPRKVVERARSLELWHGVKMRDHTWELELVPCFPINLLFRFANVRQVRITTTAVTPAILKKPAIATMRNMVKQSIIQLPLLQILTLEMPKRNDIDGFNLLIDNATSVTHHTSSPLRYLNLAITWDAGNGRTLTWTDDTHWRSIPWKNINCLYVSITNFHRLCFWIPMRLQFLGLNPRPLVLSCADEKCDCSTPGQDWHLNRERQLTSTLQGSFGGPLL